MASDKRKIAYFGNKENLAILEDELYSGKLSTEEELNNRAQELDIQIKLSNEGSKISSIEDVVRGEVSSKGAFETKRKRIYGTTNGFQIVEIIGSEMTSKNSGEKAIIIFGNKYAKIEAERLISEKWKASLSLKYMGDIFADIIRDVSITTPTVGDEADVIIKKGAYTPEQAQEHLDDVIKTDIKLLSKFRLKLQNDLIEKSREIELASKIIDEGSIGKVININENMVEVKLNDDVVAYDFNWKELSKANENVLMFSESSNINVGDEVVIEDENLCLKKDKSPLKCNIILCNK